MIFAHINHSKPTQGLLSHHIYYNKYTYTFTNGWVHVPHSLGRSILEGFIFQTGKHSGGNSPDLRTEVRTPRDKSASRHTEGQASTYFTPATRHLFTTRKVKQLTSEHFFSDLAREIFSVQADCVTTPALRSRAVPVPVGGERRPQMGDTSFSSSAEAGDRDSSSSDLE